VSIVPMVGLGELQVTVQWPADLLINPTVRGELTIAGGTAGDISFERAVDGLSATYLSPLIAEPGALINGYYMLSVTLETDRSDGSGISDVVWGTVEAVRIITGQVSSERYVLVEDVNRGSLAVNSQLESPIRIILNLENVVLTVGDEMTAVASIEAPGVFWYQWYLIASPIVGETSDTIALGSEMALGVHWLDVLVREELSLSSARIVIAIVEISADAPTAVDDVAPPTSVDAPITVDVVANDSDPNHDPLTVVSTTNGRHGSVRNDANGSLTYMRNPYFNGSDSFSYTISDNLHGSDSATVSITITPDIDVGEGVTFGSGVTIGSGTSIQDGATIGDDVVVGDSAVIGAFATVGDGATVGEYAVLKEGAALGAGSVLAANAEMKDGASVGVGGMIGPGSQLKNNVSVGDGAQIGAGTQLMENAVVGDNIVLGDGSQIKQDVVVGNDVALGIDVQIQRLSIINDRVRIGDRTQVKRYVVIGTDTVIGTDGFVGTSVQIGASVAIGDRVTIANDKIVPDGTAIPDGTTVP
jgi:UDP-3-O-[3-hydroxymyristoyl] glucosamine N-acyltransferase